MSLIDRPSPVRFSPGIEPNYLLRVPGTLRRDLEHAHKQMCRRMRPAPSAARFMAFCASLGLDVIRHRLLGKPLVPLSDADGELEQRMKRPIKQELKQVYLVVYNGLPPGQFGEFICYAMSQGLDAVRRQWLG